MRFALTTAAFLSFAIYGHAIQKVFSRDYGIDWRMRLLQIAGTASAIVHLWYLWGSPNAISVQSLIALGIYISGIGVFFAAQNALKGYKLTLAFSPDAPQQLIESGIYAHIRHPFYLAYSLTWIAGVVATPSFGTSTSTAIMCSAYVLAAYAEEYKFNQSSVSAAYAKYRVRAGMFFPVLKFSEKRRI